VFHIDLQGGLGGGIPPSAGWEGELQEVFFRGRALWFESVGWTRNQLHDERLEVALYFDKDNTLNNLAFIT
jgi:hypothetical protein